VEDVSTRDFLLNPLAFSLNSPLTTLFASLPSSDIHSPIEMQLVPSGLMIILLPFIKESPRFLLTKGKKDLALSNLAWVRKRSPDDPQVLEEFAEIAAAHQYEMENTAGTSWKECGKKGMKSRFFIAFAMFCLQQWVGQNSISYCESEKDVSIDEAREKEASGTVRGGIGTRRS